MTSSIRSRTIQASATAGPPEAAAEDGTRDAWRWWPGARSLAFKFILLIAAFAAVPVILYQQFDDAERAKREVLLRSVQAQGSLVAQALEQLLRTQPEAGIDDMRQALERLQTQELRVKLLLRPAGGDLDSLFYIAATPAVSNEYLDRERAELMESGVLKRLQQSCQGGGPQALRYVNPAGEEEIVTSLVPLSAAGGCWVVMSSLSTSDFRGTWLAVPYWQTPEVRLAAATYLALAAIVLILFTGVWRDLRRFGRVASAIRRGDTGGTSFAALNPTPELARVAEEFDRMVAKLRESAEDIRYAAEETVHAFKTPIATISQALEPVRRAVPPDNARGRRGVELIETSLTRLDGLVSAARRIEETLADLVDPPRSAIDMSALVDSMLEAYQDTLAEAGLGLRVELDRGVRISGSEELLETVIENILDNAVSFSPRGTSIQVALERRNGMAELSITDSGPGVPEAQLEQIFDRYFSQRPNKPVNGDPQAHFGIGLWIVRRNVEAVGGTVVAGNRAGGGLVMTVRLPLA
ncbi:MAG TPA: ATP-binding protein [Alphaproteobacteria bacterium]|nr:ATP-binding protein [Alphaproteobacteria bacterium]